MALKAFFAAATVAAVMVGLLLPTPNKHAAPTGESQIATMALGAG